MKFKNKQSYLLMALGINLTLFFLLLLNNLIITIPVGLLFSIVLPGSLIYTTIHRRLDLSWLNATYILGIGIAYVYAVGLFANWFIPLISTLKPLTQLPLLLAFLVFNSLLCITAYLRNSSEFSSLYRFNLNISQIIVIIAATLAPIISAGGAIVVNNGGNAYLVTIGYFYYLLLVILVFIFYGRIGRGVALYTLWLAAFSILEASWLRGMYVNGIDVNKEFQIFRLTQEMGFWNINTFRDAYNSCLSVGLFPTIISAITNASPEFVFKSIIPLLYSFIAVIIFHIANTIIGERKSLIAALFFIAQPAFFVWWWVPVRQQLAFIFFSLMILVIIKAKNTNNIDRTMIMIFGLSMVASHYSTAYISIALLAIYLLLRRIFALLSKQEDLVIKPLTPIMLLTLFISVFLWYSQVNIGFSGVVNFVKTSLVSLNSETEAQTQKQDQGLFDVFNINKRPGRTFTSNSEYNSQLISKARSSYGNEEFLNSSEKQNDYPISKIELPDYPRYSGLILDVKAIAKALGAALTIIGVLILTIRALRTKLIHTNNLLLIQMSSLACMFVLLAMPLFSIEYDQTRTFQQLLIPLSGAAIYALAFISKKLHLHKILGSLLIIFFVGIYYIFMNQIIFGIMGTRLAPLSTSNKSEDYFTYFVSSKDINSGKWLADIHDSVTPIYSDFYTEYRLKTIGDAIVGTDKVNRRGVVLGAIKRDSYVFVSAENNYSGLAYDQLTGQRILYYYPLIELSEQKNTIYSNGGSTIYR